MQQTRASDVTVRFPLRVSHICEVLSLRSLRQIELHLAQSTVTSTKHGITNRKNEMNKVNKINPKHVTASIEERSVFIDPEIIR